MRRLLSTQLSGQVELPGLARKGFQLPLFQGVQLDLRQVRNQDEMPELIDS